MSARPLDPLTPRPGAGPWPHRLGLASVLCAVPLVLFGGSVTTLGAGMAVDGWLIAEGHFLLFFPVDKWFRDTATFVEHTHRLFGVAVGLCALGCWLATWLGERRPAARRLSGIALGAVCLQGLLGGLRVIGNDSQLAFLHGALAQAVFAVLCVNALVLSSGWRRAQDALEARPGAATPAGLRLPAGVTLCATYGQVVLGAWYRHGLRPAPVESTSLRFALHALGAVAVLVSVAHLARRGSELGSGLPAPLARTLRLLPVLLLVQLVLGGLAWVGFRPGALGPAEWLLSIAHVLGGGALLATVALIWAWSLRPWGTERELSGPATDAKRARSLVGEAL